MNQKREFPDGNASNRLGRETFDKRRDTPVTFREHLAARLDRNEAWKLLFTDSVTMVSYPDYCMVGTAHVHDRESLRAFHALLARYWDEDRKDAPAEARASVRYSVLKLFTREDSSRFVFQTLARNLMDDAVREGDPLQHDVRVVLALLGG